LLRVFFFTQVTSVALSIHVLSPKLFSGFDEMLYCEFAMKFSSQSSYGIYRFNIISTSYKDNIKICHFFKSGS